ncbi:hypothetical protein ACHAXS_006306 [Conticribra weissflogii]
MVHPHTKKNLRAKDSIGESATEPGKRARVILSLSPPHQAASGRSSLSSVSDTFYHPMSNVYRNGNRYELISSPKATAQSISHSTRTNARKNTGMKEAENPSRNNGNGFELCPACISPDDSTPADAKSIVLPSQISKLPFSKKADALPCLKYSTSLSCPQVAEVYIGERNSQGQKHGRGVVKYVSGCRYVGEFFQDKRNGFGKCSYHNGCMYVGNWVNGKRHGFGKMLYLGGDVYEGEWMQDLRHGPGIFHCADGVAEVSLYFNNKIEIGESFGGRSMR